MAAKKKSKKRKATPAMLGTGLAAKAGKALTKKSRQKKECKAMGGSWVNGKCQY
jgi:hypothetical protein